ncbi:MAG: PAS domain S-box protein [Rhodothermales bacterium]
MQSIPTRTDTSESARRTMNKYFLLVAGRAYADVKRVCSSNPHAFRFIGDLLLAEARFFRNCSDYSLYRRSAPIGRARGPFLAIICAQTHQWLRTDPALEAFLGYSREEMEEDWVVTLHPETCQETDSRLVQVYRDLHSGKVPYARAEIRYQTRIGYSVWAQVTHSLVRDSQGRPDRYVLAFEDCSMKRWTELFHGELIALRRIMELSGYEGDHLNRVDGLIRHFEGQPVPASLLGELVELFATVA